MKTTKTQTTSSKITRTPKVRIRTGVRGGVSACVNHPVPPPVYACIIVPPPVSACIAKP
jgi:hypothetical protein